MNRKEKETMKEKWEVFNETLDDLKTMSKREYLLTISTCILGGILLGFLFSPKKTTTIGSNNGNNAGNGNHAEISDEESQEENQEEKEEGLQKNKPANKKSRLN